MTLEDIPPPSFFHAIVYTSGNGTKIAQEKCSIQFRQETCKLRVLAHHIPLCIARTHTQRNRQNQLRNSVIECLVLIAELGVDIYATREAEKDDFCLIFYGYTIHRPSPLRRFRQTMEKNAASEAS